MGMALRRRHPYVELRCPLYRKELTLLPTVSEGPNAR